MDNITKKYGHASVVEAIENLAVALMYHYLPNPTRIVFPKGTLTSLHSRLGLEVASAADFESPSLNAENVLPLAGIFYTVNGTIELVEE
jgi:hypothetical protein